MPENRCKAPALGMGLKLIETLSEARSPLGLSELARLAGTNKNMASRLLSTLQAEGWIQAQEPGPRYSLTLKPFAITSRSVERMPLLEMAREPLRELWESTGESVYLGVPNKSKVLYLEHLDATGPVKIAGRAGGEYPLHCTAPGKAILAYFDKASFKRVIEAGLERMTPDTISEEEKLSAELALTRKRGFANDDEEYGRGIICVAAPVFDHRGQIAGAIGISTTTIAWDIESLCAKMGPKTVDTAREISAKLGFQRGDA